jgi:hypothetical protein
MMKESESISCVGLGFKSWILQRIEKKEEDRFEAGGAIFAPPLTSPPRPPIKPGTDLAGLRPMTDHVASPRTFIRIFISIG